MKIKIFIDNKPLTEYSSKDVENIKQKLTEKAFLAVGYIKKTDSSTANERREIK